jgi:small-conductance mechanosensitive channel
MGFPIRPWIDAGLLAGLFLLFGYLSRAILLQRLKRVFARTPTDLDDLLLESVRRHVPLWFVLAGMAAGLRLAPISDRILVLADRLLVAGFIASLAWAFGSLSGALLDRSTRREGARLPATSLVRNILRAFIAACAGLLLLANLGISITPLLTALGIGSLAVALALQPTLSNLIAGLHISLARPIRVGDFIELEGGAKGVVEDIGWRAIRIRELPSNLVIVPNSRIAEMIVTNFSLPEPEQAALVEVGVSYGADLEHVERVTCEVARHVMRTVPGGVGRFDPFIRYHTFGDSSVNFTVILRVQGFADRYLVTHQFLKSLKERFDREGIEIPFPQRVVQGSIRMSEAGLTRTKGPA